MRVLHFYKTSFPDTMGGVEQVINQIARGSASSGVQTDVLSLTPERAPRVLEIDGYRAHRVKLDLQIASTGFSMASFGRFAELARKADVINYHFPWPFMDLVHFATRVKKPTVVTYHSDIIRQQGLLKLYRPLKRRFLASVDSIVATSPNYLDTSPVLGRYRDKVRVIPIGVDKATYPAAEPERLAHWRGRLGPRFFLFVGLIRYYKGLHILLDAAKGTNFPIVIVGSGPVEDELRQQARRLGLQNVFFLGRLPEEDKVALLTLCYALVFPSHLRSEAFGVSLLEGAMYGKPMISSEIGTGTSYINIAGQTGLVVPPSDSAALRHAMTVLWDAPEQAAEMGRRAEERYWEKFTAADMVRSYVQLYSELAAKPRGRRHGA
jgi:glycosyltransferase involved in cell wall biosynthesis